MSIAGSPLFCCTAFLMVGPCCSAASFGKALLTRTVCWLAKSDFSSSEWCDERISLVTITTPYLKHWNITLSLGTQPRGVLACVAWRFCWAGRRSGVTARKISFFKLLPPQSPRGFSALARLYYLARPTKTAMLRRLGACTLLYKPHRYVPPQRVGFLRRFGLKTGIRRFAHFDLESDMVFEEITGMYERAFRFNFKWIRKKEKSVDSKWILRNLVCWRSI